MTVQTYETLKRSIVEAGYQHEIEWAENVQLCSDSLVLRDEFIWVVLNSGMKNQVAEGIARKVNAAIRAGQPIRSVFNHPGKAAAIERARCEHKTWLRDFLAAEDKLIYLESLPWIGPITKFHLGKNLGLDCAKPDRHLERIAKAYGTTTVFLCDSLSAATGDRVGTVDLVVWRAANLGLV